MTQSSGTKGLSHLFKAADAELAFENQRLYDIIRFGKGIDILGAYAVAIGANFTSNDLLLPFPQIEIGLSKGLLKQNPGY